MATKKSTVWPKITKGTHLTVYTYEDGSTKLEWDNEALLKEVQTLTKHLKPNVRAKTNKKVPAKTPVKKTAKKTKE